MQAHDQDELRKAAERVLARRIATDSSTRDQEQSAPARPRDRRREPQRPREFQSTPERPREFQVETERPREYERGIEDSRAETDAAAQRALETIHRLNVNEQQATDHTERRPISSSDSSNARREDHAYDIGVPRRGEIYELLHARDALRRAFIMNEVLGKPLALREPNDP